MRVKVCGMTQLDQVRKLEEMGIDFAGFIFYPKSPGMPANILLASKCEKQNCGLVK